ncbi:MAG: hypothetical protein KAJ10_16145, partial [Thermodesulfovibrionia bacterium]|nr:hypothetical protein [Thermodesulfovibrionia bacterium]
MKAHALKPETPLAREFHSSSVQLLPKNTVWRAFQAGMRVLYRYSSRSRVDSVSIAKANLQLLHQTLLKDQS